MYRSCIFGLLAGIIGLIGVTQAARPAGCRPALAFKEIRFSEMQPPTMERKWTAQSCRSMRRAARRTGGTSRLFSRGKRKTELEMDFREQFIWKPPSVEVSVDFWADEAVERYWFITLRRVLVAIEGKRKRAPRSGASEHNRRGRPTPKRDKAAISSVSDDRLPSRPPASAPRHVVRHRRFAPSQQRSLATGSAIR